MTTRRNVLTLLSVACIAALAGATGCDRGTENRARPAGETQAGTSDPGATGTGGTSGSMGAPDMRFRADYLRMAWVFREARRRL